MPPPILKTKLYIPPCRAELVSRPYLIERLNAGLRRKLTLISAPAGFGKTTLLSEWAGRCERPLAWLSLDAGDNDPARFLAYFIAALQTIRRGVGEPVLAGLQTPQAPPIEVMLTALLNEIAGVPNPFALVLDDFHKITEQRLQEMLIFILHNQPPTMHLVIAGRADPPWPLARLRARRELSELRAKDLRFSPEEAEVFLNRVMGLRLSAADLAALDTRTEGWAAGLQMAALSMQGQQDVPRFIKDLAGSNRFILDYLVEEVLDHQSAEIEGFLLKTAILERMTAPLCDAVSGREDSQAILNRLERANLFLMPLDSERGWYRYHHLFADLLRSRLEQTQPDLVPALHGRASAWYERQRMTGEAVNHALRGRDFERAARLLEQNIMTIYMQGELTTLLTQLKALPAELVRSRPWLRIYEAWALAFAGQVDQVEPLLQEVEEHLQAGRYKDAGPAEFSEHARTEPDGLADESRDLLGNIAGVRAFIADMSGNLSRAVELAQQANDLLPAKNLKNLVVRSVIPHTLARAYWLDGDIPQAGRALAEVARIGQAADNIWTLSVAKYEMAAMRRIQGRLHQADAIYRETMQLITERGSRSFGTVAKIDAGLSALLREWNDLKAARQHALLSVEHMQKWKSPTDLVISYLALARVLQAQGEFESAADTLQKAEQLKKEYRLFAPLSSMIETSRVRLWLAQGNLAEAARWARESSPGESGPLLAREMERITLARMRLAQGKPEKALPLLHRLAEEAAAGERGGSLIEVLVLQALARQAQGNPEQAMSALERALLLAEPEGFVRIFIGQDAPMGELLRQAAAQGIAVDYVGRLLLALDNEPANKGRPAPAEQARLIEPLSERELQVLRYLATDLSVPEIAAELVVAVSTVRSHVKRIYSKFGVHSRYEAVARARELKLLVKP